MKKVIVFVCVMVIAMAANADTMSFQNDVDGYDGTHDTYLGDAPSSSRSAINGGGAHMTTGSSIAVPPSGPCSWAQIKWDIAAIPVGATITGATVDLTLSPMGYADGTFGVHEFLNTGWTEMNCNWYYRDVANTISWNGYGAKVMDLDYVGTPIDTYTTTNNMGTIGGKFGFENWTFDLPTTLVQSWVGLDVADIGGLKLVGGPPQGDPDYYNRYGTIIRFMGSETATADTRYAVYTPDINPKLTIEYIPEPITLALVGLGGLFLRRKK